VERSDLLTANIRKSARSMMNFYLRNVRAIADVIESTDLFWWGVVAAFCVALFLLDRLIVR
jgi:hypothetical protein